MYNQISNGTRISIQGLDCWIPPEGYVVDFATKELEFVGVYSRSEITEEQYWERKPLPVWYKDTMKRWTDYDKKKKDDSPDFYDDKLDQYQKQEWSRRLNGFWYTNKGKSVYLTGMHYMFMQWFQIDIGYPRFRRPDLDYFYFLQYCLEDPECMGMLEITKRRFGKTFRGGLFLIEYVTRNKMTNAGIQSKTGGDAKKVFGKAVINPFKKLPRFFRPEYDMSLGITPKSEIRFQQTNVRGKKAEEGLDKEELGSMIDHQSADIVAYDGQKIHRYFSDEWAKCFGKGTRIRMYDGSIKNVEDIGNGELVMGNDSTARLTYGSTSGKEEMFRIIPKKGKPWECNVSHILSLKWCLNRGNKKRGWAAKSVVNITVRDFLKLQPYEQRHLMLYKAPIEYTEQLHELEPYFLGLWLGDGSKYNPEITTADNEVVSYLKQLAIKEGLELCNPEHIQYRLHCKMGNEVSGSLNGVDHSFKSCRQAANFFGYKGNFTKTDIYKNNNWEIKYGQNNRILTAMQRYGLVCNKHIPTEFIIDSRKNRLDLLAGLVDSDGHISKGPSGKPKAVEITQKIKHLAYQISELATSLGFYSSVMPKIATMRRADKSLYECPVYKVMIYGNLWDIPTKVARKQVPKIEFHVNRRTSAHCGFSVESVGVGEYYGFSVDDNHLFLLEDGTVVHNTTECNIYDRHDVIRYCLLDDDGKIIGKALYSSTVEKLDSEKDGVQEAAENLWNDSDQLNKKENNRTASGLYRFFMTADRGRNIDIYGDPDEEKTVKEILADRAAVSHNSRALSNLIKKEARTIQEAFSTDGDKCIFNVQNIDSRDEYLKENPVYKRKVVFEPTFDVSGKRSVRWRDINSKEKSFHWEITFGLTPDFESNKFVWDSKLRKPCRNGEFAISVDGYGNNQGGRKYGSKASAWLGRKYDVRDPNNTFKAIGNLFGRPEEKSKLHEQVMLCAEYFSCQAWFEHNSDEYDTYFKDRGKRLYLGVYPLSTIPPDKRETTERHRGFPTTPFSLTRQNDVTIAYFENYCHLIDWPKLLDNAKKYDPYNRTAFDMVVSFEMLIVCLMEPVYVPPPVTTPLVKVYPNYGVQVQIG